MNTQTALERCFNYFLDETHKPGYRDGDCVYYANGSEPVRCAIGCLIPEKFQERAGKVRGGLHSLFKAIPELETVFADVHQDALIYMQSRHDVWANPDTTCGDHSSREDFLADLQSLMCCYKETQ